MSIEVKLLLTFMVMWVFELYSSETVLYEKRKGYRALVDTIGVIGFIGTVIMAYVAIWSA